MEGLFRVSTGESGNDNDGRNRYVVAEIRPTKVLKYQVCLGDRCTAIHLT